MPKSMFPIEYGINSIHVSFTRPHKIILIYRVQSKVVRRPFSLQPLVADVYFQLQNCIKKCKDLCYGIFKFQKSIL